MIRYLGKRFAALMALLWLCSVCYAQSKLEQALERELQCNGNDQTSQLVVVNQGEEISPALQAAGANVVFEEDGPYNNFTYYFAEPLKVFGLPVWSVQQSVHAHGAARTAEVASDAAVFARRIQARRPTTADYNEFYLSDAVTYLKRGKNSVDPDLIIIGLTPAQRSGGRFFIGCYRQMKL